MLLLSVLLGTTTAGAQKRAMMWIDGEANFGRFSHTDSIDYYLYKIHSMGFTDVVVDVRPITGEVLFDTPHAPRMREWQGVHRTDFDYLGHFLEMGHKLGMRVYASMNVFVAGHNFFDRGQVYTSHPEWASVVYTPKGIKPITQCKERYSAMVNPLDTTFRHHIVAVMQDLLRAYPTLDGIITDRVRYDGIEADFSDLSRKSFEACLGKRLRHWPGDVMTWTHDGDGHPTVKRGRWFKQWVMWRAQNIYQAMHELRDAAKAVNPAIRFGTYTGAWYPSYYEVGVNFASRDYNPATEYDWATPDYRKTGYRELLDLYITGNYYTDITEQSARERTTGVRNETDSRTWHGSWYSVEGSCRHLRQILGRQPFYGGLLVDQLYGNPDKLRQSVEMNLRESDGLMVFDICHLIARPELWQVLEQGMRKGGMLP